MRETTRGPRVQDLLLALLFIGMAAITPDHDPNVIIFILLLGALQITESRFIPLETARGKVIWNLVKLVAAYLLIGYTHGVTSPYYFVLLFPVISAAATLGVISTLVFTGLACGSYLSFLLYVDWSQTYMDPDQVAELIRRLLFLGISGLLVNTLAEAIREQSYRYKLLAEELATTNRNLREAERQVLRAERLAALGQLTAGLAHELRNPLGTIKASADMLDSNLPAENVIGRELAGYISSEVDRTNSLVSRFLDFARPLEVRRVPADLAEVLTAALRRVQLDADKKQIALKITPAPHDIGFSLDAELMERVFINLLLNAIQASPPGETVAASSRTDGDNAIIEVADHGSGIAHENIESIFNPFFTTKPEGTGLGLAIVAKIVDEHGGKVNVFSSPAGTTFSVCLPMSDLRDKPEAA